MDEQKPTLAQKMIRQEAIRLKNIDGKAPFKATIQFYSWTTALPLAQK